MTPDAAAPAVTTRSARGAGVLMMGRGASLPLIRSGVELVPSPLLVGHACRSGWRPHAVARGSAPFADVTFTIKSCRSCGLGVTDPVPSEAWAPLLYGSRESSDFQPGESGIVSRLKAWAARRDLILVRHVLEHTYDPVRLLARLRALLRPAGTIVIEVPALDAAARRLWGRNWAGFYAPYHTLHFTRRSLSNVVGDAGLAVVRVAGAEVPFMGRSLQNRLQSEYGLPVFAVGLAMHPVQLAVGALTRRPSCIRLWASDP